MNVTFDGQQEGERILYEIKPHPLLLAFTTIKIVFTAFLFLVIVIVIGMQIAFPLFWIAGICVVGTIASVALWWARFRFAHTTAYITDRRIVRIDQTTPFTVGKRALFWNEVLKAKAYEPNVFLKSRTIGSLSLEPQAQTEEEILIHHVAYAQDLANYIDKILFTYKNDPISIQTFKSFIPKPRGQRD